MNVLTVESEIWSEYLSSRSPVLREKLVLQSIPLVHYIMGRLGVSPEIGTDYEDLIHQGLLGLIDAVDKYDPSFQTQFSTYASVRIRGKILDYLRSSDWMTRSARKRVRDIRRVTTELWSNLQREPSDEEIAQSMNIDVESVHKGLEDSSKVLISLDALFDQPDDREGDSHEVLRDETQLDPSEIFSESDLRERLIGAIHLLSEREQQVLALYYTEELTYKEIGRILGISESRVCQLHSRAIINMKAALGDE